MSQAGARDVLAGLMTGLGVLIFAIAAIAVIGFHGGTSIDMVDIKRCGVKNFGGFQTMWMLSVFAPLFVYLILRGFVFRRALVPFLIATLLLGGILAGDIWYTKSKGIYGSTNMHLTEFCQLMRSIFPAS